MNKLSLSIGDTTLLSSSFKDLQKHDWMRYTFETYSTNDEYYMTYLNFCLNGFLEQSGKLTKRKKNV